MANNLEYIIMLHAQQTTGFTQLRQELESLKQFVEKGADFPIRLGDVKTLKKQVQEAIRESLKIAPTGGTPLASGGGSSDSSSRQLEEKLTKLTNALDSLVSALQRERPVTVPPAGGSPVMSNEDFGVASGAFSSLNSIKDRLQKQKQSKSYDRYARLQADDVLREVDEAFTGIKALGAEVPAKLTDQVKSLRTRLNNVSSDPSSQRAQQAAKTAVDGIFQAITELVTQASNDIAGNIRTRTTGGSVPLPGVQVALQQGQGDFNSLVKGIASTMASEIAEAIKTALPATPANSGGGRAGSGAMWERPTSVADNELERAMVLAQGGARENLERRIAELQRRKNTARDTKNKAVESLLEQTIRELEADASIMGAGPPGVNSAAVRNVGRAMSDPSSVQAKALASGFSWYDTLSFKEQAKASSLAQQGFIPIPMSGRQRDRVAAVTGTINKLYSSVPYSVFSSTGSNEVTPEVLQARGEWDKRLAVGRTALEQMAASNGVPGGFAALPQAAGTMLAEILRRQRTLELEQARAARGKGAFSSEQAGELQQIQNLTSSLPLFQSMGFEAGAPAKELYRALYQPRNFMLASQADREMGRRFVLDPNVPKEYQIAGSALSIQELMDMGSIEKDKGAELLKQVEQWRKDRGLTFYRSSERRENNMMFYAGQMGRLRDSLLRGELPENVAAQLRTPEAFSEDEMGNSRLPKDVENWLHWKRLGKVDEFEQRLSPNMVQKRINPMAYRDVIEGVNTRLDFAEAELLQGGVYGKATDEFIKRRGYIDPQLGPMILTSRESEAGKLLIPQDQLSYGGRHLGSMWTRGATTPGGTPPAGISPTSGMPSMPGDGVRVYVTNWPDELGSAAGKGQLDSMLARLKRATDAVVGVRPPGDAGIRDVLAERKQLRSVDVEQAKQRIRVEATRDILDLRAQYGAQGQAQARMQSALRRRPLSGLDRLDNALPTGMDAGIYSDNPETWRGDVASFYGRYRRAISSTELARLAAFTETDPQQRAKLEGRVDDKLTNQALARIQLAQVLRLGGAAGLTPASMPMGNIEQFLQVAQGYTVARSGVQDLKELAELRSGLAESSTGGASRLRSAEQALASYERMEKLTRYSRRADELSTNLGSLISLRDQRQTALAAMPSQDDILSSLDGAKNAATAAQRIQSLLGLKDQDMIGFGPAVKNGRGGYDATKVVGWVEAIRQQRQAELDEAERNVTAAEGPYQTWRGRTPQGTQAYQERMNEAQSTLVKTLGAKNFEDAQAKLAKLRAEIKGNEDQMKALGGKSQETLSSMSAYFVKIAADVEKANPKLAALLRTPLTDAKALETVMKALGQEFNKFGKSVDQAAISLTADGGYFGGLTRKFRSLSQYMMAGGVLYTISNSLRTNLTQLNQLDAELASVQGILDGRSPAGRRIVEEGALETSRMFGTTPLEAVRSARLFAQTGAGPEESVTLGRAAQAAQIGLGIDQNTATEMLVSTRNVFDNVIKPFEVLDRIARLEARYAVSTNDLSQAIQRAGPLFEQFQPQNMGSVSSLDLLLGSTTSIVEQTRVTGNQAATSLRFMMSRLAQPDVARKLQTQFGINLAGESPDEMRPVSEIFKDISKRYNELMTPDANGRTRSLEAANLLVTFAGARQANAAAALLEKFSETLDRAAESSMAYGDVQERLRIQLDTVPGRLNQFQAALTSAFQEIYARSGVRDVTKGALGGATGLLNLVGQSASPGLTMVAGGVVGSLLMRYLGMGTVTAALGNSVGGGLAGLSGRMMTGMSGRVLSTVAGVGAEGPIVAGLNNAYKIFGKVGSVFGAMTGIGGILAGMQAIGWLFENLISVGDKYKTKSFDMAALRESETGQDLAKAAEKYGMNEDSLIQAFSTAANEVFSPTNLASLGLTRADLDAGRFANANATAIERAFLNALQKAGVDTARFFPNNEQGRINEAMTIATNIARFANAPNQDLVAQLRTNLTQVMDEVKQRAENVRTRTWIQPTDLLGQRAQESLYSTLASRDKYMRDFNLVPGLQNGTLMLGGSRINMNQAFRQAATRAGTQIGTDGRVREASDLQVITQLYNEQFKLPTQELQQLVMRERVRLTRGGDEQLADATMTLTEIRKKLLEQEIRALRSGERRADAERRVNELFTTDVQNRIRNQFSLQDDITTQLRAKFSTELNIVDPGANQQNGVEQIISNIVAPGIEGFLKSLSQDNPIIGQVRGILRAAEQGARESQPGTLPSLEMETSRGRLRERMLRPYLDLYRGSMESGSQAALASATGRGYDSLREQQNLLSNFYMGLTRVGPDIRGEMTSAQLQLALLSNPVANQAADVVTRAANNYEASDTDQGRRAGAVVRESVAQGSSVNSAERASRQRTLEAQIGGYQKQLDELFNTTGGFLSNLTDTKLRDEITTSLSSMQADVQRQQDAYGQVRTSQDANELATAMENFRTVMLSTSVSWDENMTRLLDAVRRVSDGIFAREARMREIDRMSQVTLQNFELQVGNTRRGGESSAQDLARMGLLGGSAAARAQTAREVALAEVERQQIELARQRERMFDLPVEMRNGMDVNATARREAEAKAVADFENRRLQILRQAYTEQLDLITQEENRIKDAREEQFQELLQGGLSGVREVLMSFENLRRAPLRTIINPLAQTAQTRLVDNFMDSLFGPMGLFTDKLRGAFSNGAFETYSKIYAGHIDGMNQAAEILKQAYQQAAGPAGTRTSGMLGMTGNTTSSSMGINTVEDYVGAFLPGTRLSDLTDDQRVEIEQWIANSGMSQTGPGSPVGAAMTMAMLGGAGVSISNGTVTFGDGGVMPYGSVANAGAKVSYPGRWKNAANSAMMLGGQMGGAWLGSQLKGGADYAQEGSSVGALIGSAFGPVGGMVGGLLGGALGGLFGKKSPKEEQQIAALEKIERNTRQQIEVLQAQTSLLSLDSRFLNVGAGFTVPQYRPYGVGAGGGASIGDITINVSTSSSASAQDIGQEVARAIQGQLSQAGLAFDTRTM